MPWKAFMQSSALTNSGNQLANALFMQRENASCSLNIAPKWGDSLFELFCCHLETHFEVIQEKSAHVVNRSDHFFLKTAKDMYFSSENFVSKISLS